MDDERGQAECMEKKTGDETAFGISQRPDGASGHGNCIDGIPEDLQQEIDRRVTEVLRKAWALSGEEGFQELLEALFQWQRDDTQDV